MALINREYIQRCINREAPWCTSHASDEDGYMGAGLFYYSLVYMLQAKLCVCLGSGGGFVPRIMRQAQRDLGLSDARTVLVDANQGHWGRPQWLAPDSFFRRNYPDVEVILDTTHNVATGIAKNWYVDYLHIDADHDYEPSLRDFHDWKDLMAPEGIITFHDTHGAIPCYQTVRDIRNEGHEVVDFPNVGAGFALIKLRKTRPMLEWKYLYSDIFKVRYVLAAHYLGGCQDIVEIGGYKTPIDEFLTHPYSSVVVLDPRIEAKENGKVRHLPCDYRDFDFSFLRPRQYGLAMLGFDLPLSDLLYRITANARRVVIEFPEDATWKESRAGFDQLLARTELRVVSKLRLDLSGNEYGDLTNSWPPRTDRHIYVLER